MKKAKHISLGIFFWVITVMAVILQISKKNIPVEIQFFFFLVIVLCSVSNQAVLLTKMYIEKKQLKNKISLKYYIYTLINILYILFCIYVIFMIFLFF